MGQLEYRRTHTLPDSFRYDYDSEEMSSMLTTTDYTHHSDGEDHENDEPERYVTSGSNHKRNSNSTMGNGKPSSSHHSSAKATTDGKNSSENAHEDSRNHDMLGHGFGHDNNRWGRGIVRDAQRTLGTHWCGEMSNFNLQTVAVSFFLFFACIAPAITFGAIYQKATHNWMGGTYRVCGVV